MKNTVIYDNYNEIDFKPSELIQEYVLKTEKDIDSFFLKDGELVDIVCPGCGSLESIDAFMKFKMQYRECESCKTLFISPRPKDNTIAKYYLESEARSFWLNALSKETSEKRNDKIVKPRLNWILDAIDEYCQKEITFADINTVNYNNIKEILSSKNIGSKILINPYFTGDSVDVDESFVVENNENWHEKYMGKVDVVSIFEVADHASNIDMFFSQIRKVLKPDGLCFMTSILSSGFDIQVLWDKADNLYPPDRLNVFSIKGLQTLFEKHDFECIEFSTPGILDVDIVRRTIKNNPGLKLSRFEKMIIDEDNDDRSSLFQEFLQTNLLSSFSRIILRKKG